MVVSSPHYTTRTSVQAQTVIDRWALERAGSQTVISNHSAWRRMPSLYLHRANAHLFTKPRIHMSYQIFVHVDRRFESHTLHVII